MKKQSKNTNLIAQQKEQPDFFFYYGKNTQIGDLFAIECGMEKCDKNKGALECCYNYFALHCVVNGSGFFEVRNKVYKLEKNQIFAFFPGEPIKYGPNPDDPWEYRWINFLGVKAKDLLSMAKFTPTSPVYSFENNSLPIIFEKALNANNISSRGIDCRTRFHGKK